MIFGELESFFSLWDRAKRAASRYFSGEAASSANIARRFVDIFEHHGIHRNQIPHFLGGRLTHAQVRDDETLLEAIDEDVLVDVTKKFAVRREWLDGADEQIYPLHDFYKKPEQFSAWIETLNTQPNRPTGVLVVARDHAHEFDALLIFEEQFAWLGDKPIYRYHISNNWMFSYWKSRAYLAACVTTAWKRDIFVSGRYRDIDFVCKFRDGEAFLDHSFGSALPMSGEPWYPEDLALLPDAFLENLDDDDFDRRSGLELWLSLENRGYLESDLPSAPSARREFEIALEQVNESRATE